MSKNTPLVAGNWKMNGLRENASELVKLSESLSRAPVDGVDVMICPPATLVLAFSELMKESIVQIGAEDCHTGVCREPILATFPQKCLLIAAQRLLLSAIPSGGLIMERRMR